MLKKKRLKNNTYCYVILCVDLVLKIKCTFHKSNKKVISIDIHNRKLRKSHNSALLKNLRTFYNLINIIIHYSVFLKSQFRFKKYCLLGSLLDLLIGRLKMSIFICSLQVNCCINTSLKGSTLTIILYVGFNPI